MADFRHVTNLQTPFDGLDEKLLEALGDGAYRVGPPVPAQYDGSIIPKPLHQLVADGIVGLYVTFEALANPAVARKTGWGTPPLAEWNKLPLYAESPGE